MSASTRLQQTRTRPGRPIANTTKPVQTQQPTGVFNLGTAGNNSVSPLSVFLTSLKLLDLDLLPDWPGISPQTFATTGAGSTAAQGHKKRVQCVEWALFHLFSLWDPDETKSKLKPFFPPLDQVQSINLRAALLRALEQAKKNGVLGRDALIRKTMLDECKGERLEEVLASFSIAVLKKVVADDLAASGLHHTLAVSLALENRGYKEDKTELEVLNLAHRVKLRKLLERRGAARERYRDFSDLLSVKEKGIARRSEETRARQQHGAATLSNDARSEMRRVIRNNWTGDEHWMETLLYGSAAADRERLMATPFERVWRRVQQGRLADLEESSGGLLEQLDARVRKQSERLEKWKAFRKNMSSEQTSGPTAKSEISKRNTRGIDLGFGAHEGLRIGRMSPRKLPGATQLDSEYVNLVQGLREGLEKAGKTRSNPIAFLQSHSKVRTTVEDPPLAQANEEGAISDMSDLEDADVFTTKALAKPSSRVQGIRRLPSRPKLSYSQDTEPRSFNPAPLTRRSTIPDEELDIDMPDIQSRISPSRHDRAKPIVTASPVRQEAPQRSRQDSRKASRDDVSPEVETVPEPASPTQDLADDILESMNQASPSPTKPRPRHALSLADRTRLSMARGSSMFLQDEEPELPLVPTPDAPTLLPEGDGKTLVEESEDLISRTRRSMVGFEKARQKAQLERRRSQRRSKVPPRREGSYFPKVDEGAEDQTLLAEEIMEEDMEAVFRSRPKIKASPLPSPTREWDD